MDNRDFRIIAHLKCAIPPYLCWITGGWWSFWKFRPPHEVVMNLVLERRILAETICLSLFSSVSNICNLGRIGYMDANQASHQRTKTPTLNDLMKRNQDYDKPFVVGDQPNSIIYLKIQFNTLKKWSATKCNSCFMHPDRMDMAWYGSKVLHIWPARFGAAFLPGWTSPFITRSKQYQVLSHSHTLPRV